MCVPCPLCEGAVVEVCTVMVSLLGRQQIAQQPACHLTTSLGKSFSLAYLSAQRALR